MSIRSLLGHTWTGVVDMGSGPVGICSCSCLLGVRSCTHNASDADAGADLAGTQPGHDTLKVQHFFIWVFCNNWRVGAYVRGRWVEKLGLLTCQ